MENEPTRVTNRPQTKTNRFAFPVVVALLCLVGVFLIWRSTVLPRPTLFARTSAAVTGAVWHDGVWYWMEGARTPKGRLIRGSDSGPKELFAGEPITSFAVGEGKIAWIAGAAGHWSISAAAIIDGSGRKSLWSGSGEPRGLFLAGGNAYWLDPAPPLVPKYNVFAPLGPTVNVVSVPLEGGEPKIIGAIMEPRGEAILGLRDGLLYIVASRAGLQDATTIYSLPTAGGTARRLAGEVGEQHPLLARDGSLYWPAPSDEAAQQEKIVCIRRIVPDRKDGSNTSRVETLQEWLPSGGKLYDTGAGVYYVDGGFYPSAWPISAGKKLPRSIPLPGGYTVVAVGDRDMLVQSTGVGPDLPLFRTPLP